MNGQHPKDYPDAKIVCYCEGMDKGEVVQLIHSGDDTPQKLRANHMIGGSCRYCRSDVALLCQHEAELKKLNQPGEPKDGPNDPTD